MQSLQSQTDALQPPVESLRNALVDQAELQNLLDRQQLQIARSADAAIDLVDRVAEQLDSSLADGAAPAEAPQTSSMLQSAANKQAQSAAALKKLAEHYGRLESDSDDKVRAEQGGRDLTEQLSTLRDGDREPSSEDGSEQLYQQVQELAALAEQDPRSVLEQLERELPYNPPMSVEMSKLSQQTTRQALDQLEQAAQQQKQLSVSVEQSDPNFEAQMQLMLHDVQRASNAALRMLDTLANEAKWTASASHHEDIASKLTQSDKALRSSINQARSLDQNHSFNEVQVAANELQVSLVASEQALRTASEELAQAVSKEIHKNENELKQRQREMLDRQRRIQQQTVRDAQQVNREEQQHLQQLDNELRQAEKLVQQTAEQQQNARKKLEQQPDQQWLQNQIAEREPRLEMDRASQAATKKLRDAIAQRAEQASQGVEQVNSQQPSELQSKNPTAELSAILTRQSAEASRELADKLQNWQKAQLAEPLASATELGGGNERESEIGRVVEGVADDLSRAARHEARLDRESPSSRLAQAATSTRAVADQEVEQATEQFADSQAEAQGNGSKTGQASTVATQAVLAKIDAAQGAIEGVAQDLREILSGQEAPSKSSSERSGDPSNSSSPSPAPSSASPASTSIGSDSPLDGQQKARLLDELDRQLNSESSSEANEGQPSSAEQASTNEDTASASQSASSQAPNTLTEAARRLAQSLSRARQPTKPSGENPTSKAIARSRVANLRPQFSSPASVLSVDRQGSDWGQLREQAADDLLETRRDSIAPRYQKQIDAYFRELAEQGRE
ncbi:MAG: hypothetical protein ABI557_12130, partial [Aureliella sp.]